MERLKQALFDLYYQAGRSVTYVTDSGEVKPYWANRYLQGLKRAVANSDTEALAYVTRMVMSDEPSRGFGYLKDGGRIDLVVEVLVADPARPWDHLFDQEVIDAAQARLAEHGYEVGTDKHEPAGLRAALIPTETGMAVELTSRVTGNGGVPLHAGEHTERVAGPLGAVQAFTGLLAQAQAAALAAPGQGA